MPQGPPNASEAQLLRDIHLAVGSCDKNRLFRANAGKFFHVPQPCAACSRKGRWIQGFPQGAPDLIGFHGPHGRFVGIEVKARMGRFSVEQQAFRVAIEERGGLWILARSLDDVAVLL